MPLICKEIRLPVDIGAVLTLFQQQPTKSTTVVGVIAAVVVEASAPRC